MQPTIVIVREKLPEMVAKLSEGKEGVQLRKRWYSQVGGNQAEDLEMHDGLFVRFADRWYVKLGNPEAVFRYTLSSSGPFGTRVTHHGSFLLFPIGRLSEKCALEIFGMLEQFEREGYKPPQVAVRLGALAEVNDAKEGEEALLPMHGREMSGTILTEDESELLQFTALGGGKFARDGKEYRFVSERGNSPHGPYGGSYGFHLVEIEDDN